MLRCGWPLTTGDMYGGSHYIMSAAAELTPQGKAILEAAQKFGDGKSLPVSGQRAVSLVHSSDLVFRKSLLTNSYCLLFTVSSM